MSTKKTKNNAQPVKKGKKETTKTEKQSSAPASDEKDSKSQDDTDQSRTLRWKMVELATQLVCAQIAASASYQAALGQAQEQRDLIKDLAKIYVGKDPGRLEPNFIVGGGPLRRIRKPRELKPLSEAELDPLFEAAMNRVQWMLKSPAQDDRAVFAEQLFYPDERLSQGAIVERFGEYKWPRLVSPDSVEKLMGAVDSWFSSHFNFLKFRSPELFSSEDEQCRKEFDILVQARRLCRENSKEPFDQHKEYFREAADSIDNLMAVREDEGRLNLACLIHAKILCAHITEFFCGSEPRPREKVTGKSPARHYKPWGLFRYLRWYGHICESLGGQGLNQKLSTERRSLNPEMYPNLRSVYPEEYRFGPLSEAIEKSFPMPEIESDFDDLEIMREEIQTEAAESSPGTEPLNPEMPEPVGSKASETAVHDDLRNSRN